VGIFLVPTIIVITMSISILSNWFIIRDRANIGPIGIISMASVSLATGGHRLVMYSKLSEVYELSTSFNYSWRQRRGGMKVEDGQRLLKYLNSSRPMRIDLGAYDYFKPSTSIRSVGKIIFYTGRLLLVTK
jgi:hypothetical protein